MTELSNGTDYLKKFSYRKYEGDFDPRWKRVLQIIRFEVVSTWQRSTFAKVLIILTAFTSLIGVIFSVSMTSNASDEIIHDSLHLFIANYLALFGSTVVAGPQTGALDIQMNIGIMIILLFAISGSGLFADDKQGKTIEIYLTRVYKKEYVVGKIGAVMVFFNLFILLPLEIMAFFFINGIGKSHWDYLYFYGGIFAFSILTSLILGLFVLMLSSLVEKRSYAGMVFFMTFVLASLIGLGIFQSNSSNEFLLLISPSEFLILLAYICLGDFDLAIIDYNFEFPQVFSLNDGVGLEYYHVLLYALTLIILFSTVLFFKIRKMTSEEL